MHFFSYNESDVDYLKKRDKVLSGAIDHIGPICREVIPDLFQALVNAIVGQQISMKAWETVWTRFVDRFDGVTAQALSMAEVSEIQKCGITMRKAKSIYDLAVKVASAEFDIDGLSLLKDEDVCRQLSTLNGVGVWTAEMVMIFSMQRPNVFSWNDLAIHRGLRILYRHRTITRKLFDKYRKRYSPFCSLASLYLWEIAGGALEREEIK